MKLDQRVAVITGAGSGIGQAMALLFAREGARILAADVNEEAARATAELVVAEGGTCEPMRVDVIHPDQVQAMIEPALTLLLGALLGWVMLSVLGPVYDSISKMKF